jgi:hypothetical protein
MMRSRRCDEAAAPGKHFGSNSITSGSKKIKLFFIISTAREKN